MFKCFSKVALKCLENVIIQQCLDLDVARHENNYSIYFHSNDDWVQTVPWSHDDEGLVPKHL